MYYRRNWYFQNSNFINSSMDDVFIDTNEPSTIEKVRSAHRDNIIDEKTKIMLFLHTLFDRDRLTREYDSPAPIKSGTSAIEEVHRYIRRHDADRNLVETARGYISSAIPTLENTYTSSSGFFNIHYTVKGSDAVSTDDSNRNGVPDYVESVGEALDASRSLTCNVRGFRRPLLDSGKSTFNIYLYDLKGTYGITFPSAFYGTNNLRQNVTSSYISMDNNYSPAKGFKTPPDGCVKVTAAHEFFHAVQNSYNFDADSWWKEASATWNEDEVYPMVNDYLQYLGRILDSPEKSLEQSTYGGVIFAKYITENFGGYGIMKSIWEAQAARYRNSINAIDYAIRQSNKNLDIGAVYNRFSASNYSPSQYYKEGNLWKQSVTFQNSYTSYPVSGKRGQLDHLAANYELFKPASRENKTLKISITGEKDVRWGFKIQKRRISDDKCEVTEAASDKAGTRTEIVCESFGSVYKEVCLIPANLEKEHNGASYSYSAVVE